MQSTIPVLETTTAAPISPVGEWRRVINSPIAHLIAEEARGAAGTYYGLACGRTLSRSEMRETRYGIRRCAVCVRSTGTKPKPEPEVRIVSSTSTTALMRRALAEANGDAVEAIERLRRSANSEARAAIHVLRCRAQKHPAGTRFEVQRNGSVAPVSA